MEAGVIEDCGKFSTIFAPGFHVFIPCFQAVRSEVSLKIRHLDIMCDTKTKDNVFVRVVVAIQYKVVDSKVPSAFYKLTDPAMQIRSYVFDVIRSSLPRLLLDEAFASKDEVASAVRTQLAQQMSEYGYEIIAALVVDLDPDSAVKNAMNQINASARLREAAAEKAEAEKILQVKAAEAEAESKYLHGLGVAKQRKAIVEGLRDTVNDFSADVGGSSAKDIMDLLLVTQYFDMLKEVGAQGRQQNTIFIPHGPQAVRQLHEELQGTFSSFKNSKGTVPLLAGVIDR
jgi:regulator of protease activity HflC (stomatin/prohibitin superfamily)